MKNKFFLFTLIGLMSVGVYSQKDSEFQPIQTSNTMTGFDHRDKTIKGSAYINEKHMPAKVTNDEKIHAVRFDAYSDQMEVMVDGKEFYLPKTSNYQITFLGDNKLYQVYNHPEKNAKGFYVVLQQGEKIALLLKEKVKYYEEVKPKTGYGSYEAPKLKREKDQFFIGYKNGTTKALPSKKKEVIALFGDHAKSIEKLAKSQKLSFKKANDLIKIFNHYSSL